MPSKRVRQFGFSKLLDGVVHVRSGVVVRMANAGDPPAKLPTFGKTDYWDHRYTEDPEPFDWYQRYSGIAALVHRRARARRARSRVGLGRHPRS